MNPQEAAARILAGEHVRMVVGGHDPDDPTLIVWLDDGYIMSRAIAGWSEGVTEPVCSAQSPFLVTYLSGRASLEVVAA